MTAAIPETPNPSSQFSKVCCSVRELAVRDDLPADNVKADVMGVIMLLSRLTEMAEMIIALFALERQGSLKKPIPKKLYL